MIREIQGRLADVDQSAQVQDVADPVAEAVARVRKRIRELPETPGDLRADIDWLLGKLRRIESTGALSGAPGGGGGTTVNNLLPLVPFEVTLADIGGGDLEAVVNPGTVNNILATNWLTPFTISAAGTHYLVADVVTADAEVTSHTLAMDASAPPGIPPTMGLPPTSFSVLIGVIIAGVWHRTLGPGSITATPVEAYRTTKVSPAPGTLPYDVWYSWAVSS